MNTRPPSIVITSGEPAGIGPDICCQLAQEQIAARVAVFGDLQLMRARAQQLGLALEIRACATFAEVQPHRQGLLQLMPLRAPSAVTPGKLDTANADYVLEMLRRSVALCRSGECDAMVTAPVQKSVISESGIAFSGHTELLGELTATPHVVMLLASRQLRVALATTHLPLRDVAAAITPARLERALRIIEHDLSDKFGLAKPRLMVLGLNPHAGERGTLGTEEQDIIEPVIAKLCAEGKSIIGPVPADTAFTSESLARADVVLAMYHDQGLPVLKATGFGEIVNVTLGLPIIRTSVDHGTALDLAGSGRARHASLIAALTMAMDLAGRSHR